MYYFSNHASGCETAEGVVFLDFRTGKYLGITTVDLGAFRHGVDGWPSSVDRSLTPPGPLSHESMSILAELCQKGLIARSPPRERTPRLRDVPTPKETLPYDRNDTTSGIFWLWLNITLVFCLAYVWINLKLNRLEPVIRHIQALKRRAEFRRQPPGAVRLRTIVSHFRRTSLWLYSRRNKCLFDSLVLTRFLYCHNIAPTLIFGVSTKPFSAHAWVQVSDVMLTDAPELALQTTPIFAT